MNSKIILCKNIKMDRDYNNVLSYTESQILELCQQNVVVSAENFSFIRANKTIQVPFSYGQCLQANYIAFQNPDYSNKWMFAWIDDVIYKGNLNTEILYTIDSWSTWYSKVNIKPCYVLREHILDDAVGNNTVPEDLNIGQLICDYEDTLNEIGAESFYWFVVACNYNPSDDTRYAGLGSYANYPQGSMWFAWLVNIENVADTFNEISEWILNITKKGRESFIQTMFALPYQAFSLNDVNETTHLVTNGSGGKKLNIDKIYNKEEFRKIKNYNNKNNKLLTYPYSFCRITNNAGSINDYKIEDFKDYDVEGNLLNNMIFNLIGVPCQRIFWKN